MTGLEESMVNRSQIMKALEDLQRDQENDPDIAADKGAMQGLVTNGFTPREAQGIISQLPSGTCKKIEDNFSLITDTLPKFGLSQSTPMQQFPTYLEAGLMALGNNPSENQKDALGKLAFNFLNLPKETYDTVKNTMIESQNHGFPKEGIMTDIASALKSAVPSEQDRQKIANSLYQILFK